MIEDKLSTNREIRPRVTELLPQKLIRQFEGVRSHHQRPSLAKAPYPNWVTYSSQQHIRCLAADSQRDCLWLATWGGVLCWVPDSDQVMRYTSEYGLAGNATRWITVDQAGIVWAAGQETGLCSLVPDEDVAWRSHPQLWSWTVLGMAPCSQGGVYVALRDTEGRSALGHLVTAEADLRLLLSQGLACKEINALLVDQANALWIGNPWGLFRYQGQDQPQHFDLDRAQVQALALAVNGGLWVGTNHGLYHFQIGLDQPHIQADDWPRDRIISLSLEVETGDLWVVTSRQVGRISQNTWQPLDGEPTGRLNMILTPKSFDENTPWVAGSTGLYRIERDRLVPAFTPAQEDHLSNAIQALAVDQESVWVGTAQGLYRYHLADQRLTDYNDDPLRDVRAVWSGPDEHIWVGSWADGLCSLIQGHFLPDPLALTVPIVALTAGEDGTLWAATLDALYWRRPGQGKWELVPGQPPGRPPDTMNMGLIQVICPQVKRDGQDQPRMALWVGTSSGLFCYRPEAPVKWISAREVEAPPELQQTPVQAMALDAQQRLWIGTVNGLFCQDPWQRHWATELADVRALVFTPEGTLWVGTTTGLTAWSLPQPGAAPAMQAEQRFTTANSGLAANIVTALAVGGNGDMRELWVGSLAGPGCYRYQVKVWD
jgi:ligand-binding sensor domain-containing protein